MTILFAIAAIAFCVLLWAALSVSRHLRRSAVHHAADTRRSSEILRHSAR